MKYLTAFFLVVLLGGIVFSSGQTAPELAESIPDVPEAIRFSDCSGDYLFIRNARETEHMLEALRNAAGEAATGLQVFLIVPEDIFFTPLFQWDSERISGMYDPTAEKIYYLEAWDIYKNNVFQKTCYQAASEVAAY